MSLPGERDGHSARMADNAILIDVDGTLVDSTYLHAVAWTGALRTHGIDIPTARTHRLIGMQGSRLLAELLGEAHEVGEPDGDGG